MGLNLAWVSSQIVLVVPITALLPEKIRTITHTLLCHSGTRSRIILANGGHSQTVELEVFNGPRASTTTKIYERLGRSSTAYLRTCIRDELGIEVNRIKML